MTWKFWKKKEKPIYIKVTPDTYKKGEILWFGGKTHVIVIDASPKNTFWEKLKRVFGKKVFDPRGYIKVKNYEDTKICERPTEG